MNQDFRQGERLSEGYYVFSKPAKIMSSQGEVASVIENFEVFHVYVENGKNMLSAFTPVINEPRFYEADEDGFKIAFNTEGSEITKDVYDSMLSCLIEIGKKQWASEIEKCYGLTSEADDDKEKSEWRRKRFEADVKFFFESGKWYT